MASSKDVNRKKALKRFMRGLLAGTCLTAATAAHAGTVTESGNNFPQSLAAALASPLHSDSHRWYAG